MMVIPLLANQDLTPMLIESHVIVILETKVEHFLKRFTVSRKIRVFKKPHKTSG